MSFSPTTQSYSPVEIPWDYTSTQGYATPQDSTATLTWNPQSVSGLLWSAGTQRIQVTCTSQAGVDRVYYIDVLRQRSYDAYLSSFTPSAGGFDQVFSKTLYSYTMSVPNAVSSMTMNAVLDDSLASISGWSPSQSVATLPVTPATTTISVTVIAQNTVATHTYQIVITRAQSSVALLSNLQVNTVPSSTAHMYPTFATNTGSYSMSGNLATSVNQVSLQADLVDSTATMTYQMGGGSVIVLAASTPTNINIVEGTQILRVVVTSQDGTTITPYTVSIYKVSSNSYLASLGVSGGTLSASIAATTYAYTINVNAGTPSLSVTPTAQDSHGTATYTFNGASSVSYISGQTLPAFSLPAVGDYTLVLRLTSENLLSNSEYTFTIHKKSSAAALASLTSAQGAFVSAFDIATYAYTVNVANSVNKAAAEGNSFVPAGISAILVEQRWFVDRIFQRLIYYCD